MRVTCTCFQQSLVKRIRHGTPFAMTTPHSIDALKRLAPTLRQSAPIVTEAEGLRIRQDRSISARHRGLHSQNHCQYS